MKKLMKIVFWLVFSLIALGIVISMVGGNDSDTKGTKPEPKQEAADPISQESFDKIVQGDSLTGEGGMTIEEVKAILGEADNETESQSGDMVMKTMTWNNLKFEGITIMFINDKVSSKTYLK